MHGSHEADQLRREYVASYPAGVLAFRLSANQAGKLNAKISLSRSKNVASNSASTSGGSNAVTLKSNAAIGFTAEARVINNGGASILLILLFAVLTVIRNRFRGWTGHFR